MRFEKRFRNIFFSINLIMTFEQTQGSKAQVWHGTAKRTSGGLTKTALLKNKHGRIVSKRKHALGKKSVKHLFKLGFKPKKGTFKAFHKGNKKMKGGVGNAVGLGNVGSPLDRALVAAGGSRRRRSRKMRGGMTYGGPLSPHSYNGQGVGTSGVNLQFVAGNAA